MNETPGTADTGINRVVWDLRLSPPEGVPPSARTIDRVTKGWQTTPARGPLALPGVYTVSLKAGGREARTTVRLEGDPEVRVTDAERKARQTFLLSASDSLSLINRTIAKAADLSKQLGTMIERRKGSGGAALTPATALMDQLRFVQRRLAPGPGEGGEMATFSGGNLRAEASALVREVEGDRVFSGTLTGPTPDQKQRLDRITKDIRAAVDQVNKLAATVASSANDQLRKH